ncbi:hypothetical protein AGMMS49944_05300 [Spirochaetia bacterium]|nr:hypothetical protein AGMMS49944_05300 [Spirochaetia bacterium]
MHIIKSESPDYFTGSWSEYYILEAVADRLFFLADMVKALNGDNLFEPTIQVLSDMLYHMGDSVKTMLAGEELRGDTGSGLHEAIIQEMDTTATFPSEVTAPVSAGGAV